MKGLSIWPVQAVRQVQEDHEHACVETDYQKFGELVRRPVRAHLSGAVPEPARSGTSVAKVVVCIAEAGSGGTVGKDV